MKHLEDRAACKKQNYKKLRLKGRTAYNVQRAQRINQNMLSKD